MSFDTSCDFDNIFIIISDMLSFSVIIYLLILSSKTILDFPYLDKFSDENTSLKKYSLKIEYPPIFKL